jgi:hypothetical protein
MGKCMLCGHHIDYGFWCDEICRVADRRRFEIDEDALKEEIKKEVKQ